MNFYLTGGKIFLISLILSVCIFFLMGNDSPTRPISNIEQARQLRAAGKFTESLKILENEVSQKPGGKNSTELAACWLNLALDYWNLGEVSKAGNAFVFVQTLADGKKDLAIRDYALASLEIIKLYKEAKLKRRGKDYRQSEALFLSAIILAKKKQMPDMEMKCVRQLSLLYWDWDRLEKFLSSANSCLIISISLNNKYEEIRALSYIGLYYSKKNNLSMSFFYFDKALSLAEKENAVEMFPESLTNLAGICHQLGQYSLAVYYLERALKIYEKQDDLASTISVLNGLAVSIYRQKEESSGNLASEQPQALLKTALRLSQQAGDEILEAKILNNLGFVTLSESPDQAEQHLNLALARGLELNDKEVIGASLNNLATIELNRKQVFRAIRLYQQAVQEASQINCWRGAWEDYAGLAACYEELGDYRRALKNYQQALATFEKIRENINFDFYKIGFDRNKRKVYEGLIRVLVKLNSGWPDSGIDEQLFSTVNQIKARVFLEEMDNLKNSELPAKSSEELTGLNWVISDFFNHGENIGESDSFGELLELENRYFRLWGLDSGLENKNKGKSTSALPALQVLQKTFLTEGKIILDYLLGQRESYCFLLSQDDYLVFQLPSEQEIEKSVKLYIKLLADPGSEKGDLIRTGAELGRLLLPGLNSLPGSVKFLTIIPDGILSYLPFETLRLSGDSAGRQEEYLVERYSVSYGFSLAALYRSAQRSDVNNYKKEFLGFGNPAYSQKEKEQILARLYFADNRCLGLRPQLALLPFSQEEIEKIAHLFPLKSCDLFLQKKATEDQLKALDLSQYRIIHLACHGLVSEQFPLRSSLILTALKKSPEDGFLTVREIYQMRLKSELVVLSACESSRGLVENIEGVIGLPRIFLLMGSQSVISSLWSVNDLATQELMLEFYRRLLTGQTRPEALQLAKIKMITSSKSHPYYWAGFILMGATGKIY
ncbi:MAG: CHAT domain-containing protein [Acidobacteriota bacterium]|nr:CHAT domain-containing protein [Acidobacteriota bacterium]